MRRKAQSLMILKGLSREQLHNLAESFTQEKPKKFKQLRMFAIGFILMVIATILIIIISNN
jgi:heme/copper-type cytochrome/quinol oxidase subunit 4